MTDLLIAYYENARKCKVIDSFLHTLFEEVKFYDEMLDIHNKELTIIKIKETMGLFNQLFDKQLDLFFDMEEQRQEKAKIQHLERIRPYQLKSE